MLIAVVVLSTVVVALVALLTAFYRRVGRADWAQSDMRLSAVAFIAAIGPFFGLRVKQSQPERPAVLEPKGDGEPVGPVGDLEERIAADDALQSPIPVRRRR
ncbi:MAG TPA: hypothetical protein VI316_00170 [Candidatus Dormibacteraeota bacterium]